MSIFFVPALLSLIFNLLILAFVFRGARASKMFVTLVVVFAFHNAIEFVGFFYRSSPQDTEVLFRLYYVATIGVILCMLLHSLSVSKLDSFFITAIPLITATVLSGLILFSDLLITGFYSIGYSSTAIKGEYYGSLALFFLVALTSGYCATFYGYRSAKSQMRSIRCLHSLVALTPITVALGLAIILKLVNVEINASGLVPIASAMFVAIMLKTESKHKLSDLRRVMPLSLERETTTNLMDLLDEYIQNSNQTNVYKSLQSGIEKEIIIYSLRKCDNNITYTAKMMGLKNRSTLYSMMNRLEIDLNELKEAAPIESIESKKTTRTS